MRADANDAALVEVEQRFFRDVRNFTRDLFLTALRVADVQFELLNVDRRIDVVLHQALGEHDGIFEVVAVPRHERHGDVRAERELTLLGRGAVGQHVAGLDLLALHDERTLVDRGVLVGSPVLLETVAVVLRETRERTIAVCLRFLLRRNRAGVDDDLVGRHARHDAGALGDDDGAGIGGHLLLESRADERRARIEERNRLALHVRAHQRAVGVVVLEERNERRGDGDELLRRHVHVVDAILRRERHVALLTARARDRRGTSPFASSREFACAMIASSSLFASSHAMSSRTLPFFTTRYGVSTKPRSFTCA